MEIDESARTADIRATLETRRREVLQELARLKAVSRDPTLTVSFGKRIGEGTTEAVDRLNKVAVATKLEAMLGDVDRSIVKLDEGTYGVCDRCGSRIGPDRLAARPWAVLCLGCASV